MAQLENLNLGPVPPDSKDEWAKNADKALAGWARSIVQLLKNGLRFEDNNDVALLTVTTSGTPGTEVSAAHGLKRIPKGFIVYDQDVAGSVYKGSTAHDVTNLYLRGSVASITVKILVF